MQSLGYFTTGTLNKYTNLPNSGTLQPHEHGCLMHDTRNIVDPTTTSNRENNL
jgi:hypothetical protein